MKKEIIAALFILSIVALIVVGLNDSTTSAQEKVAEKPKDSCITSKCHATMGKDKFVHGPVVAGECTVCHGNVTEHKDNPEKHKFGLIKEIDKTCYTCHGTFKPKKFLHNPVEMGECTACHSPHGSSYKFQLIAEGGDLCFNCHDKELVSGKYVHGPAAVGGCIACHDPHAADYEKNLKATGPALCFGCHTDQEEAFQKATVRHKPVTEDCIKCHNPHSEAEQFMLRANAPTLCFGCHKEKEEWVIKVPVQHGALMVGKSCLNCHEPHVSNIAKRLSMAPMDLCLSCHDKEVKTPEGKTLTNMKKLLEDNKDHHGPIKQKDCSGCHNPHGSENFRILRNQYPSNFYMPFSNENYNLCFSCHEKTIVQSPATTKLTNFRNGEVNLHFKHVKNPGKGRTCRACHETHASNYPKHIRASVPYGKWELPLNYQKTETGGSCSPGCHKSKSYDRAKMVVNE